MDSSKLDSRLHFYALSQTDQSARGFVRRSPKASLSPKEFMALRALKWGFRDISDHDRSVLLSMGFAVDEGEATKLSPAGLSGLALGTLIARGD